jgi:hypothetical protein
MNPAEKFSNNPLSRETLAGILRSPELHEALAILKAELEPRGPEPDAAIAASQRNVLAGACHVIAGLKRLAAEPAASKIKGHKPLLSEREFKEMKKNNTP